MASEDAEELGRFRRNIERADLAQLGPVIADTLDQLIDALRALGGSNVGVEMAAALSAELHSRCAPLMIRSPIAEGHA